MFLLLPYIVHYIPNNDCMLNLYYKFKISLFPEAGVQGGNSGAGLIYNQNSSYF